MPHLCSVHFLLMLVLLSAVTTTEQDGTIKNKIYIYKIKKRYTWTNLSFCVSFCYFYWYHYSYNICDNKGSDFLLILILISMIRYFISGMFIFHTFNRPNKINISKTVAESAIYTILLTAFKIFVIDRPIITAISSIIVFACLLVSHKLKTWRISLMYSLFVTCMLEYTHFLIFKVTSIVRKSLGFSEVTYCADINLTIFRLTVLTLYFLAVIAIYKFNKVNIKSVRKLSEYSIFPIFLGIALFMIMYLKHYIKYTESNKFHNILSVIFVVFIVLCLTFLFSSEAFLKKIENYQKRKTNQAIEEAKIQKGKNYPGLIFSSENLNHKSEFFKNELILIGLDAEDKKAKQLVHSTVLLSQENSPKKVNMVYRIYLYTGEILGLQPKSIEANISNLLKNHWNSRDSEILKKIKQNYHGPISEENGAPTPKEFLLYLVEKYEKDNKICKNTEKVKHLIFKKCSLDV